MSGHHPTRGHISRNEVMREARRVLGLEASVNVGQDTESGWWRASAHAKGPARGRTTVTVEMPQRSAAIDLLYRCLLALDEVLS